jgi:hypothetical protein
MSMALVDEIPDSLRREKNEGRRRELAVNAIRPAVPSAESSTSSAEEA